MPIRLNIERLNNGKKWTQQYAVELENGMTVLSALIKIKEIQDPTLSFTASCRSGICGACAVRVNGQAVLACETPLKGLLDRYQTDTLTIAPLANFTVLRDLIVDWEPKYARMKKVKPWLLPKEEFSADKGCRQSAAEFKKVQKNSDCILCGACVSECSKASQDSSDFLDPFTFVKAQKYVGDSRDKDALAHLEPAVQEGLWKCMHCQECVAKCPKSIEPAEDIAKLRIATFKKAMSENAGSRHAKAFYDDINEIGRLDETKLAFKTEGVKSVFRAPFAYRLMRVGKLAPFESAEKIGDLPKVQAILKAAKEGDK